MSMDAAVRGLSPLLQARWRDAALRWSADATAIAMHAAGSSSNTPLPSSALSTGLGGPLWVFTWTLAAAPVFLTPIYAAWLWRYPPWLYSGDPRASYEIAMSVWRLLLLVVLWRAALLLFRRAAGFPSAWLLLIAVVWLGSFAHEALDILLKEDIEWRWSSLVEATTQDRFAWAVSIVPTLYLWLSPHARRAFRGDASVTWGPLWLADVLRDGPNDWSRGFWLIPGFLLCAIVMHVAGALDLAADALRPVPPPAQGGTGLYAGFAAFSLSEKHVYAARLQWSMHLLAFALLPFACHAFVRRRPRTVWLVVALLTATIAAPLAWIVIDPPQIYVDGPDHAAELLSAIVLSVIVLPALWSAWARGRFDGLPDRVSRDARG